MNTHYLPDRIPVPPTGLVIGDKILIVHTEGAADEQVEVTVKARSTEYVESGHAKVTVWWGTAGDDGERPHRVFDDPGQWLSCAHPRLIEPAPDMFVPADFAPDFAADVVAATGEVAA